MQRILHLSFYGPCAEAKKCPCALIRSSFTIQSIYVLMLLTSRSSGWCAPLDTSHSSGISPLLRTMQSGQYSPVILNMGTQKLENSPLKTPPPHSLPPSAHPSIPAMIPYSWAPCNRAFYERKHPLWGTDTFWIWHTKCFIFLLVSPFASPVSLIIRCHSLASSFLFLLTLPWEWCSRATRLVQVLWFSWSSFDMEIKWLHSMSELLRKNPSVSGSGIFWLKKNQIKLLCFGKTLSKDGEREDTITVRWS